jgi:cytochrome c oxidase subunit IV
MSTRVAPVKSYIAVLSALIVLTVLTVALSFLPLPEAGHIAGGLVIAVLKASLVIVFFMHAIQSPRITWCVILISIVFLLILFSLTLSDVMTRSLVPFMPGH